MRNGSSGNFYSKKEVKEVNSNPKKILIAVDGSKQSLRGLSYASFFLSENDDLKIYLVNVIEWTDENDESFDEILAGEMEERGRKMLKSVVTTRNLDKYERIVKLGDPGKKIVEIADKLDVDMIIMGNRGLGNTRLEMGHVSSIVLRLTLKPILFLK